MATCGNCKKQGQTVEHIRQCYGQRGSVVTMERPTQPPIHTTWLDAYREHVADKTEFAQREAEQEQAAYAAKMARDTALMNASRTSTRVGTRDSAMAAAADPKQRIKTAAATLPALRKMHYALLDDVDGNWKFYRVDQPEKGKWAGYLFLDVQAGDDYWPVKNLTAKAGIIERIAANPEKAASDYGHQIGKCGICSRTLTDPKSIERGIGPVCANNAGW